MKALANIVGGGSSRRRFCQTSKKRGEVIFVVSVCVYECEKCEKAMRQWECAR